ncbi:hypothetical protein Tco_0811315 [Tanacetum coccineum]
MELVLGAQEDASKQGRKITNLDADAEVTLVDEIHEMNDDNLMFDKSAADPVTTAGEVVTTANVEVTTASAPTTTIDKPKAKGVVVQDPSEFKTTSSPSQASQLPQAKDKGKAKMVEPEKPLKKKDQIAMDGRKEMFDKEMKRVNTFVDMNIELVKSSKTRTEESSKRAGNELESDKSKKQKIDDHVEAEKDDQEEAEMKRHIEIVKDDEVAIDAIPLATNPLVIVEYKIDKDGMIGYFKLIRAYGSSKRYSSMIKMLQDIDREDLETL